MLLFCWVVFVILHWFFSMTFHDVKSKFELVAKIGHALVAGVLLLT